MKEAVDGIAEVPEPARIIYLNVPESLRGSAYKECPETTVDISHESFIRSRKKARKKKAALHYSPLPSV